MRHLNKSNAVTWLSFGLALFIHACMLMYTLPTIEAYAGGALAFDMRPSGYSFDEANSLLTKLGEEGRHFYLSRQLVLDAFYPALLALALFGFLKMLANSANVLWRKVLMIAAYACFVFAALDYMENILIAAMLLSEDLHPSLVHAASWTTIGKSLVTSFVLCVLLIALCVKAANHLTRRVWPQV